MRTKCFFKMCPWKVGPALLVIFAANNIIGSVDPPSFESNIFDILNWIGIANNIIIIICIILAMAIEVKEVCYALTIVYIFEILLCVVWLSQIDKVI